MDESSCQKRLQDLIDKKTRENSILNDLLDKLSNSDPENKESDKSEKTDIK